MIPKGFKRKKKFVTDELTDGRTNGRMDRRDGWNSYLDLIIGKKKIRDGRKNKLTDERTDGQTDVSVKIVI